MRVVDMMVLLTPFFFFFFRDLKHLEYIQDYFTKALGILKEYGSCIMCKRGFHQNEIKDYDKMVCCLAPFTFYKFLQMNPVSGQRKARYSLTRSNRAEHRGSGGRPASYTGGSTQIRHLYTVDQVRASEPERGHPKA